MSENNAPSDKLVWLDLEMTGLDPDRDRILDRVAWGLLDRGGAPVAWRSELA